MKKNAYIYELRVIAPPNSAETNQALYGGEGTFVNMDFGCDIHAREQMGMLFQDAIQHCLHLQLRCGIKLKDGEAVEETTLYKHLQRKIDLYERMQQEMKLGRVEENVDNPADKMYIRV